MNLTFTGKTVLVTGANCGIGLALAPLLIEEGLFPILCFRNSKGKETIGARLSPWAGRYDTAFLDLARPERLGDIFADHPGIHYLVDMAQGDYETLVASADPGRLARYMAENVAARAELVRLASRAMVRHRFGRMIFLSSAAAGCPGKGQGLYGASKLGAEGIYRSAGLELGSRGITAMGLRPGYVASGRGERFIEQQGQALAKKMPGGCFISADEVARALVFFLSDTARNFNGVAITMDGGFFAGK
jgi:3-oxoacyl-[acyl-carrier protein] reductase